MEEFQVSVIIPVYNAEKYIQKAIESALSQAEVREIIAIEDKSPDNSLALLYNLAKGEPRIKIYQHPDKGNHGAGASRNLGIAKAQSEFIAFLDADDYYLPNRFKKDKELFKSKRSIDGVYNAVGTDYYEDIQNTVIAKDFLTTINRNTESKGVFFSIINDDGWIHSDGITVRKSVFQIAGVFDPELKMCQDTDLWLRVAAVSTLESGEINQPVAMRGVHSGNRINDIKQLIIYRRLLFLKLLNWSVKNNIDINKRRALWRLYYRTNIDHLIRSRKRRIMDAINEAFKHPFLLGYYDFYKTIPFFSRILK